MPRSRGLVPILRRNGQSRTWDMEVVDRKEQADKDVCKHSYYTHVPYIQMVKETTTTTTEVRKMHGVNRNQEAI